jgi:hypothetical protein
MAEKRIYTAVSGKAVQGLQRLVSGRDIYVSPAPNGYTVITRDSKNGRFETKSQTREVAGSKN